MKTPNSLLFHHIAIVSAILVASPLLLRAEMDWIPVMAAVTDAATEPVTTKGLGDLCKVANDLPQSEEPVRQEIYKMVCAGLVSLDDTANFEKLYKRIADTNSGCDYIRKCYRCNGSGHAGNPCSVCSGSGVCPACHGQGGSVRRGLSGASDIVMPCGKCGRSGKCSQCKGSGRSSEKCTGCAGKGKSISKDMATQTFLQLKESIIDSLEEKSMAAKGLVRYGDEWVTPEERNRRREAAREEQAEADEEMRALGLVKIGGKWMTPDSLRGARFRVFQIYEPGHALCRFAGTDIIFCLLFSASNNRNVAEGDAFTNDLYRCGTYSYTTVAGAPSTVRMYAIDLEVALKEINSQK